MNATTSVVELTDPEARSRTCQELLDSLPEWPNDTPCLIMVKRLR